MPSRSLLLRWVIVGTMSLVVACGSQSVEAPPAQEPVPSSAQAIVNGTGTTVGANPWQAMLFFQATGELCGGSILNEYWLLTAQHCVRDEEGYLIEPDLVVAGVTQLSESQNGQLPSVAEVIPYPGFVGASEGKDVALVHLSTPLDFDDPNVKPIALATAVDESSRVTMPGVVGRATGWGSGYAGGGLTNTLQTTDLILQSNSVAQAAYPADNITADQLTASALGTGTCNGDSGGPLTVPYGDTRVLAGVTSWGYGCGDSRYPPMFARVSSFEPWIRSKTCILSNGGTTSNLSLAVGEWTCAYTLSVPAGASNLTFELSGGTGDADLYVKFGSEPTLTSSTCQSTRFDNQEQCTILGPSVGTYYVKVRGFKASSGMRLKVGYSSLLDFGGMWGYANNGQLMPNPATGADVCPAGYKPTRLLGTPGLDWDVFLCSRPQQPGREPLFDFGGMWGYVGGVVNPNPYTFEASCPIGYTDQKVLGTLNVDYEIHVCYKPHVPGTAPEHPFGGMMGQVNGGTLAPNPATGAASCPASFLSQPVSGMPNIDWSVHFCYVPPTRWDFGGMWGFEDGPLPLNNPATGTTTCPPGYKATQLLGTNHIDWGLFLCSRPHQQGSETFLDFGGMWGYVNHVLKPNPFTNAASCPAGFTDKRVLGASIDYPLHLCYKHHVSNTTPTYPFGGMWGQVNGGNYVPNPATGGINCPAGFTDKQVLGSGGVDYEVHFCASGP
ncbi:trypsin-like serine protease [Corallococcus exiguus]|uniref:trypsin-like serine protease n=1 Tax=Corallococcus exiguus TaxID=83462 RepID=UPI001A8C91D5|nr:trypsin-like serine protease [Corallococcus exiguus]MBN8468586.1 trypsin-like serine protease [Corallococcus exiguus]